MIQPILISIDTTIPQIVENETEISKGDTLKITFRMYQNSVALDLTGQTVHVILRKEDGNNVENIIAGIYGNEFTTEFSQQATLCEGKVIGEIQLITPNENDTCISNKFTFEVGETFADDVLEKSADAIQTLINLNAMLDVNTLAEIYNARDGFGSLKGRLDIINETKDTKNKQFKKSIFKQLPLRFNDYDSLILRESLDYIYPQSFTIDWDNNEIFVVYNGPTQTDTNKKWIVVFDLPTATYKSCFSAGYGLGEGIVVKTEGADRYLYVKTAGTNLGKFLISVLPLNMTTITPIAEYNVGLYADFNYKNGTWLIEQTSGALGGIVRRTRLAFYDDSFAKKGEITIDVGNTGAWNSDYANYITKRQGIALGNGYIIQSMGGFYNKGDAPIPYNYSGTRILDMKGNCIQDGLINPASMIGMLEQNGYPCDRVESEGIHVSPIGDVYSLVIHQSRNMQESKNTGIIIFKEFSEEKNAFDFTKIAVNVQGFSPTIYETGVFPRSGDGNMYNPLTGELLNTMDKILNFMLGVDLRFFSFYSTSVSVYDFSNNIIATGMLVTIYNANNNTFFIEYYTNANTCIRYRVYGTSGSRTVIASDSGWIQFPLLNSVSNYSTGQELSYRKVDNRVSIRGAVKNITALNTIITNLPAGFRPSVPVPLSMPGTSNRFNRFTVSINGDISLDNTSYASTLLATDWYPINTSFLID
jgi:hypothetical protein